jgi:hypothetical protein
MYISCRENSEEPCGWQQIEGQARMCIFDSPLSDIVSFEQRTENPDVGDMVE